MADKKVIKKYYPYGNVEVNDIFKRALYLSKGATNNPVAFEASQTGMPAELIVEYYSNTMYYGNLGGEKVLNSPIRLRVHGVQRKLYSKGIQYGKRVPDFRDTVLGRQLVDKLGEDTVLKMLVVDNRNKKKVIPASYDAYMRIRSIITSESHTVKDGFYDTVMYYNNTVEVLPKAFKDVSKAELDKLADKGIDLSNLTSVISNDSMINNTTFRQDFPKFFGYDIASYANMPQKICNSFGNLGPFSTRFYYTFGSASYVYGTDTGNKYNALLAQFMYKALEDMGVGLVSTTQNFRNTVGAYNKITKKVIAFNEKYQKMISAKRNSIEPAIIRDTLVGMFNQYSDNNNLGLKMFVREDKVAPTLEQLKPSKTKVKSYSKVSTQPKSVDKEAKLVINGVELKCTKIERSR